MKAAEKHRAFAERILGRHRNHARMLPWRKARDPYAILVAEVLLRRTTARQVVKVYEPFISRYPTPKVLASAPLQEIEELVAPLGLKGRARHLKEIASRIEEGHGGEIPRTAEPLLAFPGVGRYVSNAVLCFAFGEDLPVVDDSVIRVMERVFSLRTSASSPEQDSAIWDFVAQLIPRGRAREFNWGLLDFAAEICTARGPRHNSCFLGDICANYKETLSKKEIRSKSFTPS